MKVDCPNCNAVFNISEKLHYKVVKCPKCGTPFQVLGADTFQVSKDYIDELTGGKKKKKKKRK
jgi:predicted Zn finger-like uncharacterized protein